MALNYHLLFKIVLVGDPEVGKSATLKRCANDSLFPSTFGVHFLKRKVEMGEF